MDPSVGHLYHDSRIRGTITAIDAKEQLRMRRVNAREQRHLDHEHNLIDRAKAICERSRKWEQVKIQRLMITLQDRTQPLDFLLKEANSYNKNPYEGKFITTLPSLVNKTNTMLADDSPKVKAASYTYQRKPDSGSKINNIFKKRSNNVVRKLGQLYDRSEERKKHPNFQLSMAQTITLEHARIALRGTGSAADADRLLAKAQGVKPWNPLKRTKVVPTLATSSSRSDDSGCQGKSSSSSQSMSEGEIIAQSTSDSAVVRTRFPKLSQFSA